MKEQHNHRWCTIDRFSYTDYNQCHTLNTGKDILFLSPAPSFHVGEYVKCKEPIYKLRFASAPPKLPKRC